MSSERHRKKLDIMFPLLPTMDSSSKKSISDTNISKKKESRRGTLPRLPTRRNQNRKQYDSVTEISEYGSFRTDDESSTIINYNTNNGKHRPHIRASFNTEHEFLERELSEMKDDFKKFRKKHLGSIMVEANDGDNFNEIEYIEKLKECINEYEKKSKLKCLENDILYKKVQYLSQAHLDYTKRFAKFKNSFETKILSLIERIKDLYFDHISKCCCNFSSIDGIKFHDNEIIEEEYFCDDNSVIQTNVGSKYKNKFYINVIFDYDTNVKKFNDHAKSELKEINKLVAKQSSFTETFLMFIRQRVSYVGLCEEIVRKCEDLVKNFFEWTKQDKKFLDRLSECIEDMQRESKEKDSKRLYLQSRLHLVQKRLQKTNKDIELLRRKQAEFGQYVEQMVKRDELIDMECDRMLYKISKVNLEIKEFDETWNSGGFLKRYTHKNQFARSQEKKLHVVLYVSG
jgi:hypothetical protein